MKYIYSLDHFKEEDDESTWKNCGYFTSRKKAMAAKESLMSQKGFRDHPENFLAQKVGLNVIFWDGGFSEYTIK